MTVDQASSMITGPCMHCPAATALRSKRGVSLGASASNQHRAWPEGAAGSPPAAAASPALEAWDTRTRRDSISQGSPVAKP